MEVTERRPKSVLILVYRLLMSMVNRWDWVGTTMGLVIWRKW